MDKNNKIKIFIGIPTMASVHTYLMARIVEWVGERYPIQLYASVNISPVDQARNDIVDKFLKSDSTHLFFIDSDTMPPRDAITKLLSHDKDIVSGLTPIVAYDPIQKKFYNKPNCATLEGTLAQPNTGLKEIKGAGGSCIMIKRQVFETIGYPYFRNVFEDDNKKKCMISEDIFFITQAIAKGHKAYCDTSVLCEHYKPILAGWN